MAEFDTREAGLVRLGPREVQIWGIWLTASDPAVGYYRSTLSLDERHRADRFRFENLKLSYTLSRGGLRILLAHYLGRLPNEIELVSGPKGKPALRDSSPVRFNASHSGQMALYAFTLGCELGDRRGAPSKVGRPGINCDALLFYRRGVRFALLRTG